MIRYILGLIKPLVDRVSSLITLHQQKYNLIEVQYTERLYREMIDELLYLDLMNDRTQKVLERLVHECKCLDSECKKELLSELSDANVPIGIGTLVSDRPDSDYVVGAAYESDD